MIVRCATLAWETYVAAICGRRHAEGNGGINVGDGINIMETRIENSTDTKVDSIGRPQNHMSE